MPNSKNKLKFPEYLTWIFNKFIALHAAKETIPAYQLKDIKRINDTYTLLVQINGTGKSFSCSISEIALDDSFLQGFSVSEIRKILQLYFDDLKKPEYKIISQKYCSKERKFTFCLRKKETGEIKTLTSSEISLDKAILNKFSPEDAHRVGFMYAKDKEENSQI